MCDIVRAELFKLAKRPAAWVLLAAAAVLNQIFSYLVPYLSYRSGGGRAPAGTRHREVARQHPAATSWSATPSAGSRCSRERWLWCSVR